MMSELSAAMPRLKRKPMGCSLMDGASHSHGRSNSAPSVKLPWAISNWNIETANIGWPATMSSSFPTGMRTDSVPPERTAKSICGILTIVPTRSKKSFSIS